jgi:chromosome segregation ATPase
MTKLSVVAAPSPVPVRKPISGPRDRLRSLLDQRAGYVRKAKELEAAADRLTEIFTSASRALTELAEFDRKSAAAMLEWSQASLKPRDAMPVVDADARLSLLTKLAAAKENADAATRAKNQITASINAEAQAAKSLESAIDFAVAKVISEEAAGALIDDLRQAVQAAIQKQERLRQAVALVYAMARSINDATAAKPFFDEGARLAEVVKAAAAPPAPDALPAFTAWQSFAAALRTDPGAALEG